MSVAYQKGESDKGGSNVWLFIYLWDSDRRMTALCHPAQSRK